MASYPTTEGARAQTFDAIVIGSGISGGWAAKELCEQGLRTLVLERGRDVKHREDYPTALKHPWEFPHRGRIPHAEATANPIVKRCYAYDEGTAHFFVKDAEHPYVQEKPFDWIRGYQVGGKSLIWARQTQRWSRFDFEGPARDGFADWPITYDELAPWYSHVERFAGISGNFDGLETLPDGEFLPAWEMNDVEKVMAGRINAAYADRRVIQGRCAHLTQPKPVHNELGRGQCQARNLCYRGCPFGAYFSSNSATLPAAAFGLPLLMLCDTPGIMVGPEVEKTALVRRASRMFVTSANLSVPVFTLVLRKSYGLGALGMAAGGFHTPRWSVSWPSGEFGGMGLEGFVRLGFRREMEAIEDPAERQAFYETKLAELYSVGKALNVATYFELDDVIDPADTRRWVLDRKSTRLNSSH